MKTFSASWSGKFRKATAVVTMIVALFVVEGLTSVFAADYATIHFYPSPACIGVGDTVYLKMYGWAWGALGTKWTSDNSTVATTSGQGVVTGNSAGTTNLRLKDGFGQIIKTVNVTVKNDMADCASFYMPGTDLTPQEYAPKSDSFTFEFVSDTQGCSACSIAGGPNLVTHEFAKAFAAKIVNENPAFVVNGGDVSSLGGLNQTYEMQWRMISASCGSPPTSTGSRFTRLSATNDCTTRCWVNFGKGSSPTGKHFVGPNICPWRHTMAYQLVGAITNT